MKTKRFLSIVLTLAMLLGMLPGMSLTASAADTTTTITSPATTGTMTITLTIAAASVKTAPEANTLTYSGSAQTLTTTGEAGVGTLQYQLGESATTEPTGTWGTTVPQGTEAKDYYVWYRSRVNDNNISTAGCKTVTIAQASITNATVTLSDTSLVYNGSEQSVTVSSVKLGDTTLTADKDYDVTSGTTGTAKNTYTVTVTGKGNYKDTATAQWSIGLATPTIETIPTASAITYGQKLADSTLTDGVAKLGDNTVAGTFAWKNTETKPAVSDSDTTEYDVVFTPTDDDNYVAVECKVKLTVNKADPTNTVGQLSAIRGQTLEDVALPTADNGTWSWEEDTTTTLENAGMATYHAKFTPNDTANYNTLENVEVEIQVAEKPSAVAATVTANNRTYDGSEKPLVNVDNSTLVGGEMRYALGTATEATQPYTTSIPSKTDAGTYYVWYKVVGDENHADSEPVCVTVVIAEKIEFTVTFKVVNGSWDDGSRDEKTVVLSGTAGEELKLAAGDIPSVGAKPDDGYQAGIWDEEPSTKTVLTAAVTYTYSYVQKEAATVTMAPAAKTLTYTGSAQELVSAGEAEGGEMQYVLGTDAETAPASGYSAAIPTGTEAGTYYVWYKVVGDENHTDSEPVCVTVLIAEKQVDPMPLNVEIHNYTNTGANGVPGDVPRTEFKVTIQIIDKESGEVVSTAADVAFEVMGGPNSVKVSLENVEFDEKVSDLSEAKYQVVVTGFPAKVTGVAPMSQEYALSYTAWPGGSKLITIYLKWDDGKRSEPEWIKVYALPEDEIGAYTIREDGTKEYLIFHTYDICMRWLGSDELCRGYERCFHKENPYVNPFVKDGGLIGENLN